MRWDNMAQQTQMNKHGERRTGAFLLPLPLTYQASLSPTYQASLSPTYQPRMLPTYQPRMPPSYSDLPWQTYAARPIKPDLPAAGRPVIVMIGHQLAGRGEG